MSNQTIDKSISAGIGFVDALTKAGYDETEIVSAAVFAAAVTIGGAPDRRRAVESFNKLLGMSFAILDERGGWHEEDHPNAPVANPIDEALGLMGLTREEAERLEPGVIAEMEAMAEAMGLTEPAVTPAPDPLKEPLGDAKAYLVGPNGELVEVDASELLALLGLATPVDRV